MTSIYAGLFDSTFSGNKSATYGGDNTGESPQNVTWMREQVLPVTFYTDMRLDEAIRHPSNITKVAWLIEPYSISYTHYEKAIKLQDSFDYILTFDKSYLQYGPKWKWYAFGGSWIARHDWGAWNKSRMFSLIGTNKGKTRGHNMRHQIAEVSQLFGIDVMGRGYREIPSKVEALRPYRYSIVVENERIEGYFTEKLIDCISQFTVPIYWGCPSITNYFSEMGIIRFETVDQLINILVNLQNNDSYLSRYSAMSHNVNVAEKFTCAEDWMFSNLPEIFQEK